MVNTTLLVGDTDGRLYGIDALTGKELWRTELDGEITSTPVFAEGALYVATSEGTLYSLE